MVDVKENLEQPAGKAMIGACRRLAALALLAAGALATEARAKKLTVGVVQTVIENRLDANRAKLLRFLDEAKARGCQLVVFPEGALWWADVAVDNPTRADLDAAIAELGDAARRAGVYVVFGVSYKRTDRGNYRNWGAVFDPRGRRLVFYQKNMEVPERFFVHGVPCNLSICSDRGYLEHSDLPCLVQGSQVIIDISGGHGGDDGRPDLRWIRYRPWAARTGAYVIVSNPVHDDADFMGHSPWGGGSAVVRPDGSIQAARTHQPDVILVERIDTDRATRREAELRRNHPLFRAFWDMGRDLLEGKTVEPVAEIKPHSSAERRLTIAAAQMACSRDMGENTRSILRHIAKAAEQGADVVAFPELAVTGNRSDDVSAASQPALDRALVEIRNEAKKRGIYVIVGMPYLVDGARENCAFVVGDDGTVVTRYAQIVARRDDLFRPGKSTKAMGFSVKGVRAVVTIGDDADWPEIADLAAGRGMQLHFHLTYRADASADAATLRKQKSLLMLRYAKVGLVVNAADPSGRANPSGPAGGMSMIVSREGGHNQPAPEGVEYYLPYQTSIAKSAGPSEKMIRATRTTSRANNLDLHRHWRNRNRKGRAQQGWHDWIRKGASLF
ncbi:MAG: carbon-nitrogen hydrolase family protein [Planctomycetota bacterium]|jgi:predicted amidohydrolase